MSKLPIEPGRRSLLGQALAATSAAVWLVAVGAPMQANAQAAYPSRPITVIVPFGAGTASDITTRLLTTFIERKTGANLVVQNRVGALGIVGTQAALQATADGYTVLMTSISSHSVAGLLSKQLSYDPIKDFSHLALLTQVPATILVAADSPFKSINDLIKHVKENPGKASYSYASGSTWITGAKFHKLLNLDATAVSYKSSQESLVDLLGRRIDYMVSDGVTAASSAKGGKTRVLLVLGDEKFTAMADAPFMKEAGLPPMQVISWTGIAVPAAAPRDAKLWLRRHFIEALNDPELRKQLEGLSAQVPPTNTDPDKFVGEQLRLWTDAARMGGISAPQ